jgi:hypothetical protein
MSAGSLDTISCSMNIASRWPMLQYARWTSKSGRRKETHNSPAPHKRRHLAPGGAAMTWIIEHRSRNK